MFSLVKYFLITNNNPEKRAEKKQAFHSTLSLFRYPRNHTPLHEAIIKSDSIEEINQFINKNAPQQISLMSRTLDDDSNLPIDLIKLDLEEKIKLHDLLLTIMIDFPFKKSCELLNEEIIIGHYALGKNTKRYKNLRIACIIANEARKIIIKSESHPQTNFYSREERNALRIKTEKLRAEKIEIIKNISREYYIYQTEITRVQIVLAIAQLYIKNRIGSCDAFSYIALYFLLKNEFHCRVEIFCIAKGDHIFLVLDRKPGSDLRNFETWGDGVVCDAWSGEVYLAIDIPHRLFNFTHYRSGDSYCNVVIPINWEVQYLEPCFEISSKAISEEEERKHYSLSG